MPRHPVPASRRAPRRPAGSPAPAAGRAAPPPVLTRVLILVTILLAPAGGPVLAAPPAAAAPAAERAPNLLLITVDTLRPDALGWVAGTNPTPALDELARGGVRFPAAVAPVPLTLPSHVSMMTGLVPRRHGVRDNGQVLAAAPATLAEFLGAAGYATAAVVSGFPLAAGFGLERGFDHYDDTLPSGEPGRPERLAGDATGAAVEWLRDAPEPWFLWVHYYDPHHPYAPPPPYRRPGGRGAYDGEVVFVDRAAGRLLSAVARQAESPVLTVFAGDHGESLGEHGEATHGFFIYDSTVLVPLVFHFPGRLQPRQLDAPARLVDLAPTVLELLGRPPLAGVDGVSLAVLLGGGEQRLPPAYLETHQPWTSYGWSPLRAIREPGWKLIAAPRPELYDLEADPAETDNRVDGQRRQARRLEALMRQAEAAPPVATAHATADPEAAAQLRALGYLGGGVDPGEPPAGLADPKDRLALRDLLTEAEEAMLAGDRRRAIERFDRVLAEDPGNRFAWFRSGVALGELGDFAGAVDRLRRAVEFDPGRAEARSAFAQALTHARRFPEAVEQWREAAALQPARTQTWVGLGNSLGLAGRPVEAVAAFERAVALAPDDPEIRIRLAFAQYAADRPAAAVAALERAAADWSGGAFPQAGALGILLVEIGRPDEGREWLERSRPGEGDYARARLALAGLRADGGDEAGARQALAEALAADPGARRLAAADPRLAPLLAPP